MPPVQCLRVSGSLLHSLISGLVGEGAQVSLAISGDKDALLGEGACLSIEKNVVLVTALYILLLSIRRVVIKLYGRKKIE